MMRTPQEHPIPIAAGAYYDLCGHNRMVTFSDLTAGATLSWAIDNDPKQRAREGFGYELPEHGTFNRIRLYNDGAASLTVVVVLSEGRVYDNRSQLSEALDSIDDRLAGEASGSELAKTNVAATGSTGTALFAANADRKIVSVTASEDNSGFVYIGFTDAVTGVAHIKPLFPGGEWYDEEYQGAVFAVGSDGSQNVVGYEV